MVSLKKSMKWDEDVYGLEYDLVSIVTLNKWSSGWWRLRMHGSCWCGDAVSGR